MVCTRPLQATFKTKSNGKKEIKFATGLHSLAGAFYTHNLNVTKLPYYSEYGMMVPCGNCIACRLEKSRQWAVRCMHEASLYDDNCFITLTFNPESLRKFCKLGLNGCYSLNKEHMQDFNKRLRIRFARGVDVYKPDGSSKCVYYADKIRTFYCGEYGEVCANCGLSRRGKPCCTCEAYVKTFGRPHYHEILFNVDFPDKKYWKTVNGCRYYTSDLLSSLWSDPDTGKCLGFSTIGSVTFESCAYVSRYVTKKINGQMAKDHYQGLEPEFAEPSRRPGLAHDWIAKYWRSDVYPRDELVVRGHKCKPPHYYDEYLEKVDPEMYRQVSEARMTKASERMSDNTAKRLSVKEQCLNARIKNLVRSMENGSTAC